MFGRPLVWALSTTHIVTASLVLAVFCTPALAYAANLGAVTSVTHGGKTIVDSESVFRSDFSSITNNWTFNFTWPSSVPNQNAMLAVVRGTFGSIAGGTPQEEVNFAANFQIWPPGTNSIVKSIGMPPLGGLTAQSGTYTVLIAHTNGGFNQAGTMQWFATGGTSGQEPVNYRMMTFTYSATDVATELPGALSSVQYGPRQILPNTEVPQEEVAPNVPNPSQFWRFNFTWPNAVANQQALVAVFKGTYGALDGGAPVSGTNYAATVQAWAAGNNNLGKFMSLPGLETEGAEGTYTVLIAERDPKFSANPLDQEALWFSSGGTQGVAPRKYSTFTFTLTNPPKCCSSVLFLPGLKGSRLTYGSDTLWPPSIGSFANDVGQLALNTDGTSINDIKVDGVLEAFYTTPIYSGFTSYLDGLVASDTIKDWEPLPYDWRLSPERIIEDGVELQSGILNLVDEVERLANESYSDKVMIVAHSYGGLVAKRLIAELHSRGKSELVESLVLVGSPQLGTPQAVASMLHGAGESIGLGYIVNPVTSRQVALHMESAYHLLPSRDYFDRVPESIITFDPESGFTDEWRAFWGPGISNYVNFFGFVTGADVLRTDPDPQSLRIPEIASPTLLTNADAYHNAYDSYVYPPNLNVVQIAGWGLPTVKSIDYRNEHFFQSYRTKTTVEGDNTVVYPSAVNLGGISYYFDLAEFNALENEQNFQHRDLLNSRPIQTTLTELLNLGPVTETSYITLEKPDPGILDDQLVVSSFSPIVFGAYDSLGRFTGIDPYQDLASELLHIRQEIPGSYFLETGESNSIYLPSSGQYNFVIKGLEEGPATLEVSTFTEASTTLAALFKDFEVSSAFSGSFTVDTTEPREVQLIADTDSDGDTDVIRDSDLKKRPLAVKAKNKTMTLGGIIPMLDAELVGFVGGDTAASTVTGVASCSTTATQASPIGVYPVACTVGTLESGRYEFITFEDGALIVTFHWSGFQQPIDDPTATPGISPSVFKAGSTVPVKFKLRNASGVIVEATVLPQWLTPTRGAPLTGSVDEPVYSDPATTGSTYRYDSASQQYIYNWKTNKSDAGYWYRVYAKLDDGTIRSVMIGLR